MSESISPSKRPASPPVTPEAKRSRRPLVQAPSASVATRARATLNPGKSGAEDVLPLKGKEVDEVVIVASQLSSSSATVPTTDASDPNAILVANPGAVIVDKSVPESTQQVNEKSPAHPSTKGFEEFQQRLKSLKPVKRAPEQSFRYNGVRNVDNIPSVHLWKDFPDNSTIVS
ncbi:hypothetical protein CYLTODRAFT_458544 [Cylindrobasidium torrendii FP15055 ss-10]|uniref:Uncharacterized protein n=1 Tax=Cylindrobasidium torrendii FP15055 ss-10 TaxID=1314674 RepID=A0A0D7AYJ0_9AGAR|nr:hypothetical protein CYLTODRAFT_458544 [Cylindrobasidium torrendii FP15055 ss-10]